MARTVVTLTRFVQGVGALVKAQRAVNDVIDEIVTLNIAAGLTDEQVQVINPELTVAQLVAAKQAIDALNSALAANGKAHLASLFRVAP